MTTSVAEFVDEFVEQHPSTLQSISRNELREIWTALFEGNIQDKEAGYEAFEDVFLRSLSKEKRGILEFRMGGWVLNVSDGLVKGSITCAFLAGILVLGGFPTLPALVLPAIVPILFDLKQVRLTKSEQHVLASLTLREEVRSRAHTPDALYEMLPQEIQRELSRLDFADFIEKCRIAGVADVEQELIALRPSEAGRFRITVC